MAKLVTLLSFPPIRPDEGHDFYIGPAFGGLSTDADGNLFGTVNGDNTAGTNDSDTVPSEVFEIAKTASGYANSLTALVTFDTLDGQEPGDNVVLDANGNLFSTSSNAWPIGGGTVFEVAKTSTGYAGNPTTLAAFSGPDRQFVNIGLTADGDLFGTTSQGGANNDGTVFEIAQKAGSYAGSVDTLVSFNGTDGSDPQSVTTDADGNLFGTTLQGGANGTGTVFEVVKTTSGYASDPITLFNFDDINNSRSVNGFVANSTLTVDASGNLFGTTFRSATLDAAWGTATVFEIAKTANGYVNPSTLVTFDNSLDIGDGLVLDANGNLFGTARGGANNFGTVFEIAKTASGYASSPTTVFAFDGTPFGDPDANLIADAHGDLFGTTQVEQGDEVNTDSSVFEIPDSGFQTAPCFASGTWISTPNGETSVEALRSGDLVLTAGGGARPVRWIGHRTLDLTRHADPDLVCPIRIRADAVAPGVPVRDLLVSPDHALFLDGCLVMARLLVNHTSITIERDLPAVTYWHVELDSHDILLAEGLATESYLDTGNRVMFASGADATTLHPELGAGQKARQARSCAPLLTTPELVLPLWQRLATRAENSGAEESETAKSGWRDAAFDPTSDDPVLRLLAGEQVITPTGTSSDRHIFVVPRDAGTVRLHSRAARPTETAPWRDDRRRLGVRVRRLSWQGLDGKFDIPMDHPALTDGWWGVENDGTGPSRWTNGDAAVPVNSPGMLVVEVAGRLGSTLSH